VIPAEGPLHGYELAHLRAGHVLVRHDGRHPTIMMWLARQEIR